MKIPRSGIHAAPARRVAIRLNLVWGERHRRNSLRRV
jgi:hypothetical protein